MSQGTLPEATQNVPYEPVPRLPLWLPLKSEIGPERKKDLEAFASKSLIYFDKNGRDGGIRTRDPLHPMQVRHQAALRPD